MHVKNFIECIRSRDLPAADVEIGHRSTTTAHLGNVSYRTGKKLLWDAKSEDLVGEPTARSWPSREARKQWDML
ncbi:MAG: hypothetical protein WKF84_18445 [Pyrinomonadaceae bacterium]